jgi:hypothetical protein
VAIFYGNGESYDAATSSSGAVARIRSGRDTNGGLAGSPNVTLTDRGGSTHQLDLVETAWELHWSPDGSSLVVLCGPADGTGADGWQLVLMRT